MLFACNGECPKNRFTRTPDGEPGLNYLCAGYKAFFQRVDEPMKLMATLMRTNRPAPDVMAILEGQKDVFEGAILKADPQKPCPCGSGMKFKDCHGWKRSGRGRRGRGKYHSHPRPPVRASNM